MIFEKNDLGKNNYNIKWHQAIGCLRAADKLKSKLTVSSHKIIYRMDYLNIVYTIIDILEYKEHDGMNTEQTRINTIMIHEFICDYTEREKNKNSAEQND